MNAPAPTETEPGDSTANGEDAPEAAAATGPDEVPAEPTLEEQLAASKEATRSMKEKMLRVAADFENYRRRASKETDDALKRGRHNTVKELLPVFDNLERATQAVDETTDVKSMTDGLRMVHKQFIDVLGKMAITRVSAVGEGFDPAVHESIQYEHSTEHAAGIVMTELQPGYRLGEVLIRPALVVVSRGPAPDATSTPEPAATAEASEENSSEDGEPGAADEDDAN
jgi:molecular chaperone GrpE